MRHYQRIRKAGAFGRRAGSTGRGPGRVAMKNMVFANSTNSPRKFMSVGSRPAAALPSD